MQPNEIKEWIKANKLLSLIIVGVIIVTVILLGANKQAPKTGEQSVGDTFTPNQSLPEAPVEPTALNDLGKSAVNETAAIINETIGKKAESNSS